MRRFLACLLLITFIGGHVSLAVAQDAAAEKPAATEVKETDAKTSAPAASASEESELVKDIRKAREIIMNGSGDNSFGRGMIIAFLQPIFIAAMFALGLWSGQMSERLKHIWVLPVIVFGATAAGAFITAYHTEWKPDFNNEQYKFLSHLESTDTVAIVVGIVMGTIVGLNIVVAPFFAIIGAAAAGLVLGFSQIGTVGDHQNDLVPFWTGFGLTGLLVNIFGIGFETFLQSINLTMITRWVGVATALASLFLGAKIF